MVFLIHHIRKIFLFLAFLWGLSVYVIVGFTIDSTQLQIIRLTQFYALSAISLLYIAVLASPLYSTFPRLPYKPVYIRARRAIGVSAFFFALTHASLAFFGQLGGFAGLPYLDIKYLQAISLSFIALLILTLMASTSFDYMVKRLGTRWKILHRFVYLAAVLITIHALMLGSHFADLSRSLPRLFFALLAFLLILESLRFDKYLRQRFNFNPVFGLSTIFVVGFLIYLSSYLNGASETNSTSSIGIHSQHLQLAQQASQQSSLPNLPGLVGDRTKRYTLSLEATDQIKPSQVVELRFKVYDASSGAVVSLFQKPYQESYHLIIVDDALDYFSHLHPQQQGSEFMIKTSFPKEARYHLYSDFQPLGAIDQQIATTVIVGDRSVTKPNLVIDTNLTKKFGDYQVTLTKPETLSATAMSFGQQKLKFTVKEASSGKAIKDLKPYLGAFGHLVMINSNNFEYMHVHPASLITPPPNANGGPDVEFLPIGIYGPFKEGVYKAFFQFNHNGQINLATFVVDVKK